MLKSLARLIFMRLPPALLSPFIGRLGLILCTWGLVAAPRPMTFLDVLQFRTIGAGTLSRSGNFFAYTIGTLDWKTGKRFTDIYITAAGGGPPRQMTFTPDKDEWAPALSADGQWLAFLSNRDARPNAGTETPAEGGSRAGQLYLMPIAGGESRKISDGPGTVAAFAWSRDGRRIAYLAGKPENRQIYVYDLAGAGPRVLTKHSTSIASLEWAPDGSRLYFRAPDTQDADDRKRVEMKFDVRIVNPPVIPVHLWEIHAGSRTEKRLTSADKFTVAEFHVSQDGRWITFTGNTCDRFIDALDRRDSEPYLLETATGKLERLMDNNVAESTPIVSPDGRWIALTAPEDFTYFRRSRLYLRPAAGGDWRMCPKDWDGDVENPAWSADSGSLYFTAGNGVAHELFGVDAESGAIRQITKRNGVVAAQYDPDTNGFVLSFQDPSHPADYFLASPAEAGQPGRWRRMSDANPQTADFALGEYETVRWKSADGTAVEGILVKPLGYEAGQRYPLIVQLHGGPAGAYVRSFAASYGTYVHVFAAGGYAVFQPNYRGSTNYGEKFRMEISGDYFRPGFDDIMTGVDEVIRRGVADPDKLGMMGWSAGGHWSNWTLTHTDRFKAISSGAGAMNWISMYAQTDVHANREFYFQGTPYENWDHYLDISPIKYIKNAKTPTLIQVGGDDQRVPRAQSEELHMALKKLGVPTEFIVYPKMPHGITEPRYQMVKMVAEYNWFEKWIKGKPGWFEWKEILRTLPAGAIPEEKTDDILPRQD